MQRGTYVVQGLCWSNHPWMNLRELISSSSLLMTGYLPPWKGVQWRCQRQMDGQHIICRLSERRARGHPKSQQALKKYCSERIYTLLKLLTSPREQDTKMYQFCNNFVGLMSMSLGCCWVVDDVFEVLIDVDAPPHYRWAYIHGSRVCFWWAPFKWDPTKGCDLFHLSSDLEF